METQLNGASNRGNLEKVKYYVENRKIHPSDTTIGAAAHEGKLEIVKYLVQWDKKYNFRRLLTPTPIYMALCS
mgnify:CR=1 FL=1